MVSSLLTAMSLVPTGLQDFRTRLPAFAGAGFRRCRPLPVPAVARPGVGVRLIGPVRGLDDADRLSDLRDRL
jgi:hypothetical protein